MRAFLRRLPDANLSGDALEAAFGRASGAALLTVLLDEGYVEEARGSSVHPYRLTLKGGALANTTAAKKVRRATADNALREFLERCQQVRGRADLLHRVRRVVLFGSTLTDATVSDVDLSVELEPKKHDPEKQRALEQAQTLAEMESGRSFSSFLQQMVCPQQRVLSFLKARSRVLQLVDPHDDVLKSAKKKVVFEDPE